MKARDFHSDHLESLRERVKKIREYVGLSQNRFAAELQISPSFYWAVEKDSKVPTELLLAIARRWPEINSTWLLTGAGNMVCEILSEPAPHGSSAHISTALTSEARVDRAETRIAELESELSRLKHTDLRVDDYKLALEQELVKLWGVGDVALVARRGSQAIARGVFQSLLAHYPDAVSMTDLAKTVLTDDLKPIELAAEIALLAQQGLIERVGDDYRVTSGEVKLRPDGVAELSQLAVQAVTELMTSILPKAIATKRHGKLVLADLYVAPGTAVSVADSLLTAIKAQTESVTFYPQGERITLVVGVGVDDAL